MLSAWTDAHAPAEHTSLKNTLIIYDAHSVQAQRARLHINAPLVRQWIRMASLRGHETMLAKSRW